MRERIIRHTMLYSAASYTAMAAGIFISLATKAILGPAGAGYWALMKVFQSYGEYADLGTRDALLREVPQAQGAGRADEAARLQRCAFGFTLAAAALAAAAIAAAAAAWVKDPVLRGGLWIVSGLVVATHLYNFFLNLLRMLKKIPALSAVIVANIALVGVFSIAGAMRAGVAGLAAGLLASTLASAALAWFLSGVDVRPRWERASIQRLVRIGVPMSALSYLLVTFLSIDTVMIGKWIGVGALGVYTIALMSVQQVSTLGRFTQIVLFPHIQERYGRTGSIAGSAAYFTKTTDALAHFLPAIIGSVMFLLPIVVHAFLPKFEPGLPAMKILTAGYFFVAVNEMSSTILYTIDKQSRLIPVYVALALLAAALNWAFIRAGWGIEGVAAATSLAYFGYFLSVFAMSFREILAPAALARCMGGICAVFAYFAGCAWLAGRWQPQAPYWGVCLLQYVFFMATQAPLLWRFERREHVLAVVGRVAAGGWRESSRG